MKKKLAKGLAVASVLVAVAAPAYATGVHYTTTDYTENVNLDFGNGYNAVGTLAFIDTIYQAGDYPDGPLPGVLMTGASPFSLYFNGSALTPLYGINGLGDPQIAPLWFLSQNSTTLYFDYSAGQVPSTFSDFTLNGAPALRGTVTINSAVPLPPALPLFAAALGFLAVLRIKKEKGAVKEAF